MWMLVTFHGCSRMRQISRTGQLLLYLPLASSTWKARSKAACRWCISSCATWRHAVATETPGGKLYRDIKSIRDYVCTSLAKTKLSENDDPWWSHHVSPCVMLLPFIPVVSTSTYSSWIDPECSLMSSSAHSHMRMECNYSSTSSHVCDIEKRTCPPSTELYSLKPNNFLMLRRLKWRIISVTKWINLQKHTKSDYKSE